MTVPTVQRFSLRALGKRIIHQPGARDSHGAGRALRARRFLAEIPSEHRNAAIVDLAAFYLDRLEEEERQERVARAPREPGGCAGKWTSGGGRPVHIQVPHPGKATAAGENPASPGAWVLDIPSASLRPESAPAGVMETPIPQSPEPEREPEPAPAVPQPVRCEHTGLLENACGHCHPPAEVVEAPTIRSLAREIWAELGGCDRERLGSELARRSGIDPSDEGLRTFCVRFMSEQRPALVPVAEEQNNAARRIRSWKVQALRTRWPELAGHIRTASGDKPIGKCTPAELEWNASTLLRQASDLQSKAGRTQSLAADCRTHGAELVEDLPDDVLGKYFTRGEVA